MRSKATTSEPERSTDAGRRGRNATGPGEVPARGWWDVAVRVKHEVDRDRLSIIAAGVAFYGFLAVFPALTASISIWGLVADPLQVEGQINAFGTALPGSARDLISQAAHAIVLGSDTGLGIGTAVSLLLTLWSANKGMKALVDGVSIAYNEHDDRSFLRANALTLGLTLGATVLFLIAVGAVVVTPIVLGWVGLDAFSEWLINIGRWPILAAGIVVALGLLYRVAPTRHAAKWRWVTPGSVIATVVWLVGSIGFSIYVDNFGSYDKTYGSVAAVAILLFWFYLSAYAILLGAEINAESERQTVRDSTVGGEKPLGRRGAYAADTVGPTANQAKQQAEQEQAEEEAQEDRGERLDREDGRPTLH